MKHDKPMPNYHVQADYGKQYMVPGNNELYEAMGKHEQHHYPEGPYDGRVVPYSVMDRKHKGRR